MLTTKKIKVLVVDDTLLMRQMIADIVGADERFEVVGMAGNGKQALEQVEKLKPDAMTLDVEMPVMDGIACLRQLMSKNPIPVVMVSSITYEGGFKTLQALEAGAFDFVQKPKAQSATSLTDVSKSITEKLHSAVKSNYIKKFTAQKKSRTSSTISSSLSEKKTPSKIELIQSLQNYVIAIGISTGGPPCIAKIFETMPENCAPILVVQHMPENFTKAMADRINKISQMTVKEAEHGDQIKPGWGYIAPGHSHITVTKTKGFPQIELSKRGPVSGHQPSADVLFESVAEIYGRRSIGIIMTGMGRDGAANLKTMHEKGAHTIAQDEESSTVFGMPKAAIEDKAVDEILSLDGIVLRLKKIASKFNKTGQT